ncbi:MAG: hypothetical protein GC181_09790 [Bacteroidetes bacterium]|nr:hypothetical protein [Bacteroidota bacterium]
MPTVLTTFEGQTVKVYPARLPGGKAEYGYSAKTIGDELGDSPYYGSGLKYEKTLPYNPFPLDDGRYIAYYQKRVRKIDRHTYKPKYSHEDTTLVAVKFEIQNERKNGKATWYNDKGEIIQTGDFKDDVKVGDWAIIRDDYVLKYHYENGLLQGKMIHTYKNVVLSEINYNRGFKMGTFNYFNEKGRLISKYTYDTTQSPRYLSTGESYVKTNSIVKESRVYNKKGIITYHKYPFENDTISTSFFKKGEKKYVGIRTSDSLFHYINWYKNGQLRSDRYERHRDQDTSQEYLDSVALIEVFNEVLNEDGDVVKLVRYFKDGKLKYQYDFAKGGLNQNVTVNDKKGKPRKTVKVISAPGDTSYWVEEKWIGVQTIRLDYSKIKKTTDAIRVHEYSGNYSIHFSYTDKKGYLYLRSSQSYLQHLYPDSIGPVLSYWKQSKKRDNKTYILLNTNKEIHTIKTKGIVYQEAEFQKSDTLERTTDVTLKQWDKKHDLCIVHQYQIKADSGKVYRGSSTNIINQTILSSPDTIDYKIYYHNLPFNGKLIVNDVWRRRKWMMKSKYSKHLSDYINTVVKVKTRFPSNSEGDFSYCSIQTANGEVQTINGGYWSSDKIDYIDGTKNGETSINGVTGFYDLGKKNGLFQNYDKFQEYYEDTLHGSYIDFGYYTENGKIDRQINVRTNYTLDTLNGWFYKYASPNLFKEKIYIDHGLPNGDYWYGNVGCDTLVSAKIKNGFLYDTARYYFSEGVLKAMCIHQLEDSEFYAGRYIFKDGYYVNRSKTKTTGYYYNSYSDYAEIASATSRSNRILGDLSSYNNLHNYIEKPMLNFNPNRTGEYTYFYKSGVKASHGCVENGFKTGTWEHWDLNGGKLKTIEYDSGIYINPDNGDTVRYYGTITQWYPNGALLLKGYITSQFTQFRCDQEMEVSFENLFYLNMWDENGKELLVNNSGAIYEFHNNGERRLEGNIKDGKRVGLWKFYDPEGRLENIGTYKNGKADGLWVSGDLEAVPHFYDRCLKGELQPYSLPDAEAQGYITEPVKISEYMYKDGEYISSNTVMLIPLYGEYRGHYNHLYLDF